MFRELKAAKKFVHHMHHNRTKSYVYIHFDVNQRKIYAYDFPYCFRLHPFRTANVTVAI